MKGHFTFKIKTSHGFTINLLSVIPLFVVLYTGIGKALKFTQVIASGIVSEVIVLIGISLQAAKPLDVFERLGLLPGDASYSIYLTHTGILSAMFILWPKLQASPNPVTVLIVGFILSCAGCIAIHFLVKNPWFPWYNPE